MAIIRRKDEDELTFLHRKLAHTEATSETRRNQLRSTKLILGRAEKEVENLEDMLGKVADVRRQDLVVPKWATQKPRSKKARENTGRPLLMLSDLHLDEVVDSGTMGGLNEYNRQIAEIRFERIIEQAVAFPKNYWSGISYDGIVLALVGDILTGTIHEELAETNDDTLPGTIAHWTPILASAIEYLADEYGAVHVPSVDGNHDRSHKKPRYKRRAKDSWMWVISAWLAHSFKDDDRVSFTLTEESEILLPVYDTNFLLVHGDEPKGGGGIAGLWSPITRYVSKKQDFYAATGRRFDYALMGHWHQRTQGSNFLINSSLKGYDEYAKGHSFPFSRPSQNLLLITPERGMVHNDELFAE